MDEAFLLMTRYTWLQAVLRIALRLQSVSALCSILVVFVRDRLQAVSLQGLTSKPEHRVHDWDCFLSR